jgi:hypothetical protein
MVRVRFAMLVFVGAAACGKTSSEEGQAVPGGAGAGGAEAGAFSGAGLGTAGSSAGPNAGGASGSGAATAGSNAGGATPAAGASSIQSAVAECQRYCESLNYRLPQALCEDWNRPGWDPQFCHRQDSFDESCADYCKNVYESLSPACAAVLPAAIRCVAPVYANLTLPAGCWLSECRAPLYTMTSACYGIQDSLAAARAKWEASSVADYELDYESDSDEDTQVLVRAGSAPVATPATAFAWTVPLLFDEVERRLHEPGVAPNVIYDSALGYVTRLGQLQLCEEKTIIGGVRVAPLR